MPVRMSFAEELRAAGVGLDGVAWGEDGSLTFAPGVDPAVRDAIEAKMAEHLAAAGVTFGGEEVWAPQMVDRVTARRVRKLLAPTWEGVDHGMVVMRLFRTVEEALDDIFTLVDPDAPGAAKAAANGRLVALRGVRQQLLALRQEGEDFKAAQGWA